MTLYCDKSPGFIEFLEDAPDSCLIEEVTRAMPKKLRQGMINAPMESLRALDLSVRKRRAAISRILKESADPMRTDDREVPWYFSDNKKDLAS